MSSAAFWRLVDRLQISDAHALELIGYSGKVGKAGKRPRFRLSSRQTHLAAYLLEIEAAPATSGEGPAWLWRRIRSAPFSGRAPIKLMVEQDGGSGRGAAEAVAAVGGAACLGLLQREITAASGARRLARSVIVPRHTFAKRKVRGADPFHEPAGAAFL
jgi:hypothetical protein